MSIGVLGFDLPLDFFFKMVQARNVYNIAII